MSHERTFHLNVAQTDATLRHKIDTLIRDYKAGRLDYGDDPDLVIQDLERILLSQDTAAILRGVTT